MNKPFTVTAIWDAEARVFTSTSDIPGLVVEADTFEELVEMVEALAPEVIAANLPDAPRPYRVRVETRRELAVA
jgi:predicted RNase H-like HicB family nuclease